LGNFGLVDVAAAIENILLAAGSKRIGLCWISSVNKPNLRKIISLPCNIKIDLIIALGCPVESPILEDTQTDSLENIISMTMMPCIYSNEN